MTQSVRRSVSHDAVVVVPGIMEHFFPPLGTESLANCRNAAPVSRATIT